MDGVASTPVGRNLVSRPVFCWPTSPSCFFSLISGPNFNTWGWRIPFILSLVLVGVGLWIRLGILETPTFQRLAAEQRVERQPVLEVIKRHPREIILSALVRMSEQ